MHSIATRILSLTKRQFFLRRTALYLGAGVDVQLALDSQCDAPSWTGLLEALNPFAQGTQSDVKAYAEKWPTETALAARLRLGPQQFSERIAATTDGAYEPNLNKPFTKALAALLLRSDLVVTPNYSSHVAKVLQRASRDLREDRDVIVLTREDLGSFQFRQQPRDQSRTYLVHIHGRCIEYSRVILDAWGYNVVSNDDQNYLRFLYNLFSYRNVICIGTSFTDVPLRNQAAFVFRTQSYQRPSHIMFERVADEAADKLRDPRGCARGWANAMHAAYGIRPIVVTSSQLVTNMESLCSDGDDPGPALNDLDQVAEFLDSCGDYESPIQQQWLVQRSPLSAGSAADCIAATIQTLYKSMGTALSAGGYSWNTMARIERHLRHFSYLYLRPSTREELWDMLADAVDKRTWRDVPSELRFSFLIGAYEIDNVRRASLVRDLRTEDDLLDRRLDLATSAWRKSNDTVEGRISLAERLLDVGWESMAAKVFLDAAEINAKKAPQSYDARTTHQIVELATRGRDIARSGAYFRREAKAQVLMAMWLPDPHESRVQILSKIRAAELVVTDDSLPASVGRLIEPALVSALTAALLAAHIRSLQLHYPEAIERRLRESMGPLLDEAGLPWAIVPRELLGFWRLLIEYGLRPYFSSAIRGDYLPKH